MIHLHRRIADGIIEVSMDVAGEPKFFVLHKEVAAWTEWSGLAGDPLMQFDIPESSIIRTMGFMQGAMVHDDFDYELTDDEAAALAGAIYSLPSPEVQIHTDAPGILNLYDKDEAFPDEDEILLEDDR